MLNSSFNRPSDAGYIVRVLHALAILVYVHQTEDSRWVRRIERKVVWAIIKGRV